MEHENPSTRTEEAVQRIVGLIREQKLSPERRLPSERQLEQQWQLGRSTLNKAVSCLIAQGHLRRVGYKLYPTGFTADDAQPPTLPASPPIHVIQPAYSPFISQGLLEASHDVAEAMNSHTIPMISTTGAEQCRQLGSLLRKGTAGFVIWPCVGAAVDNLLKQFRSHGVPFVVYDIDLGPFDFVGVDNEQGTRLAVEHLYSLGHKRIVYVTQPLHIPSLRRRCDGFIQGCQTRGLRRASRSIIEIESPSEDHVKAAFNRFRAEFADATAVAFSHDGMAIHFIQLANQVGVRVPEDLSVIGFDNLDIAAVTTPALTTIAQNFYQSGVAATQMLYHLIDNAKKGRQLPPYRQRVEPRLVVRQSTARRA